MEPTLRGRRALVTGAGSGIGRAVASHLSELGAELVVSDRDKGGLDQTTSSLERATAIVADLSDPNQVEDLARQAGAIDVLIWKRKRFRQHQVS